ncbi:MAG: hypothetical protein ABL951_08410 [Alphaproteobacteria bacterium]
MIGNAIRFVFLFALCGAAYAQSSAPVPADAAGPAWVHVDLGEVLPATGGGLQILAQNAKDETPTASAVGRHRDGIGAAGAQASAPAIKAETGFDPVQNRSEQIIIIFDEAVTEADIDVNYFFRNEEDKGGIAYHERGGWRAYSGTFLVGQGLFLPEPAGGSHQIKIAAPAPFDRLEMFATPYVTETGNEIEPGLITTDSSDFLIKHIAYRPVTPARGGITH